jgi:hypothetical protein
MNPPISMQLQGEQEIIVDLANLTVVDGGAPSRIVRRVRRWAASHQTELVLCWDRYPA